MKAKFGLVVVMTFIAAQVFACAAITKKGTQCKRAPSPGSQYCWQHGGTTKAQRAAGMTDADVAKARCKAITKAGTQCKRQADVGKEFCWQHAAMAGVRKTDAQSAQTPVVQDIPEKVAKEETSESVKSADRGQCEAMTKKGTRCSRKAQPGSTKCWQHQ